MANTLRKKTPPPPDPEELNPDKDATVSVAEVVKDERTEKIIGSACLLLAGFLFIAFTSYLFTWQEDQDKVQQFGVQIFSTDDVRVNNLLGVLGAYISHSLWYNGFGLASYLFCTVFFVIGVNLLFGKKVFRLLRNGKYVLVGLVVFSMASAFITKGAEFSWGGAVGEYLNEWMEKWIGRMGTGALLLLTVFSYFIWRFNPVFSLPEWKWNSHAAPDDTMVRNLAADDELPEVALDHTEENDSSFTNESHDNNPDEEDALVSKNKLKNEASTISVIMPAAEQPGNPMHRFDMVEKEPDSDDDSMNLSLEPTDLSEEENAAEVNDELTEEQEEWLDDEEEEEEEEEESDNLELEIKDQPELVTEAEAESIAATVGSLSTKYDVTLDLKNYKYPGLDLLETHGSEKIVHDPAELETNKNQIIATLKNYDIAIQRIAATVGPTVTLYEIVPAPGVRISRIKNLEDDIALSLAALGIRIIAPIPGKGTIGIEVPNVRKTVVSMKTLLASEKFQNSNFSLPIAIGKKIDNDNFIVDLATMPHLLMAGATGQGKSVGLNAILVSLLYKKHPSQLKFVLVDPKKVELSLYRVIEKHFLAKLPGEEESIITDTKKVVYTLNALCIEMDNRYDLLKEAGCRNIKEYNEKFTARKLNPEKGHQYLPFIVLVVDEFADLIMTAGKEVEMPIARLAQLARAIGIHLIIATQRPSVNIITGTIKANFPARIAFKVSSKIDSRTILDAGGAEQLIGKGDMLVSYNGEITRLQCAFVDTPEVDAVCDFIGNQKGYPQAFLLPEYTDEKDMEGRDFDANDRDPLFEDAARLIVSSQMGSTSLIQRRMKLGYNRAGRLMDQLEAAGIVGPNQGSKAREVLFKTDSELQSFLDTMS
ncbi:DNA translocase FtsK [Sediminibacterium sp. C3]|uniref:FtsK/SpoIIIE family DNA translocase n=1 Tax=Sediminibacterium sp. C3 TaxID=1267211 RepID=UPI0004128D2C|nr:DNA translocase FtsK [Sediminibacterium sp. C3]